MAAELEKLARLYSGEYNGILNELAGRVRKENGPETLSSSLSLTPTLSEIGHAMVDEGYLIPGLLIINAERRIETPSPIPPIVKFCAGSYFDKNTNDLVISGMNIGLTPTERKLTAYFVENSNRIIPTSELLEGVWDLTYRSNNPRDPNTVVNTNVHRLRQKLNGSPNSPVDIVLVGRSPYGYLFKTPSGSRP